jgi:hypothetical protein
MLVTRTTKKIKKVKTVNYGTKKKPFDFSGEKILSISSFGGEVKPSVPCRRLAACKRSLNGVGKA